MLLFNLKIAFRNIRKNKVFSLINIAGLAISLAAFILMALSIEDELSFDKFNTNANNIYRIADDKQTPDVLLKSAQTAAPVAPAVKEEFPEIKEAARLIQTKGLGNSNDKLFEERNIFFFRSKPV
jgi:putative ABC transport system permease protein